MIAGVSANPQVFTGQPLWLDAGDEDPFQPGERAFESALQTVGADDTTKTWPGGHDSDYWNSHWPSFLRFYAAALARC